LVERTPQPCCLVIFGASGDLTQRKLIPALYDLAVERRLPPGFTIIGCARTPLSDDEFRNRLRKSVGRFARNVPLSTGAWESFARGLFYVASDLDDFASLAASLQKVALERM